MNFSFFKNLKTKNLPDIFYQIKSKKLLQQALTHRSYKDKSCSHNERLEFLGDAVLNLSVASQLMDTFPDHDEGDLTKLRAELVSGQSLSKIAEDLDLSKHIYATPQTNAISQRVLAGTLEALFGAVYVESGFKQAKSVIQKYFTNKMDLDIQTLNHKASLQEWAQKKYQAIPTYKVKKEEGPEHSKKFYIEVFIQSEHMGSGSDHKKKQAEQMAAKEALIKLKLLTP